MRYNYHGEDGTRFESYESVNGVGVVICHPSQAPKREIHKALCPNWMPKVKSKIKGGPGNPRRIKWQMR